jgi:hypothetical protein
MATEIMRGQGERGDKPSDEVLAQLRGEPIPPKPVTQPEPTIPTGENIAAVTPFDEPPIDELKEEFPNMINEITVTGSLSKVKKNTNGTES